MIKTVVKLELGQVFLTREVANKVPEHDILWYLGRHQEGDWGDIPEEDKKINDWALKNNGRVISKYRTEAGDIYIITEPDRSFTTVLFAWEY